MIKAGQAKSIKYTWDGKVFTRKGKLVVGSNVTLRTKLIRQFHDEPVGGHSGVQVTYNKLATVFYWKGMRKAVKQYVRECDVCQRSKPSLEAYAGLLQPLPIPHLIWQEISMDFVEGLPMSQDKNVVMVVVDRLSKYGHFIPLTHPFTASQVAQLFLDNIYKLYGLRKFILSDRDKIFISQFWQSVFKSLKVSLKMYSLSSSN